MIMMVVYLVIIIVYVIIIFLIIEKVAILNLENLTLMMTINDMDGKWVINILSIMDLIIMMAEV